MGSQKRRKYQAESDMNLAKTKACTRRIEITCLKLITLPITRASTVFEESVMELER